MLTVDQRTAIVLSVRPTMPQVLRCFMRWLPLVGASLMIAGCAEFLTIDSHLYAAYLTRTYPYSAEKCFVAAQAALDELKTPVEKANAANLTIWSKRAPFSRAAAGGYFGGPAYGAVVVGEITTDHRIALQVEGNSEKCRVRATRYEVWINNVKQEEINVDAFEKHFFDPLLQAVQERLERED